MERKYSDFVKLRAILGEFCSGHIIPSLPKRPPRKLNPEVLGKYKIKLQRFLDEILIHPTLRNTEIFTQFVTSGTLDLKQECEKVIDVSLCFTAEGSANIAFNSDIETDCAEINTGVHGIHNEMLRYY